MTQNPFLPQGYEQPKGNSNYMKIEKGDNRFRIMSSPILGWLDWDKKKPLRFMMNEKPEPVDRTKPVKHFWAMIVFDRFSNEIKILEIHQYNIQKGLKKLAEDNDWGNPIGYDININREGDGVDTSYNVSPKPQNPLTKEMIKAFNDKPIYLPALFQGADPFINHGEVTPMIDVK